PNLGKGERAMSEAPRTTPVALPLSLEQRVDAVCWRFETVWKAVGPADTRPRIEDYLAGAGEPERSTLVRELLRVELYYRHQNGDSPTPEEYRLRFPEHAELIRAVLAVADPAESLAGPDVNPHAPPGDSSATDAPPMELASGGPRYRRVRFHDKGGLGEVHIALD